VRGSEAPGEGEGESGGERGGSGMLVGVKAKWGWGLEAGGDSEPTALQQSIRHVFHGSTPHTHTDSHTS